MNVPSLIRCNVTKKKISKNGWSDAYHAIMWNGYDRQENFIFVKQLSFIHNSPPHKKMCVKCRSYSFELNTAVRFNKNDCMLHLSDYIIMSPTKSNYSELVRPAVSRRVNNNAWKKLYNMSSFWQVVPCKFIWLKLVAMYRSNCLSRLPCFLSCATLAS